jgi:ligand-binding sensor domain-containing protein
MLRNIYISFVIILLLIPSHAQTQKVKIYEYGKTMHAIYEENDSIIWASTGYNIVRINKNTGTETYFNDADNGLPSGSTVTNIVGGKNGSICFGADPGGLAILEGSNWTIYNYDSGSTYIYTHVNALTTDKDKILWMGVDSWNNKALVEFDGTNWSIHNESTPRLPDDVIRSLAFDPSGNLWIGTGGVGLVKYGSIWTQYTTSNSGLPGNDVTAVAVDSGGTVWCTTSEGGLTKFDGTNWTTYDTSNSDITDNAVKSITVENNNTIWLGLWGNGVVKFDGSNWSIVNDFSGLGDSWIYDIIIDKDNNKWIATGKGLIEYNENGITAVGSNNEYQLPTRFCLQQNYPNPFNPITTINYQLPVGNSQLTILNVYDVLGRNVATLVNEVKQPGYYSVQWNAANQPSGVYLCRLQSGHYYDAKKLILVK